jgi:hypothetical protein
LCSLRLPSTLAMEYPEAKTIHLVMDNLNIHRRRALSDVFGPQNGSRSLGSFHHYAPSPGSWLNQAEIRNRDLLAAMSGELGEFPISRLCVRRRKPVSRSTGSSTAERLQKGNLCGGGCDWRMPPGQPNLASPGVVITCCSSAQECPDAVACSEVRAFRYEPALGPAEQEMAEHSTFAHCP